MAEDQDPPKSDDKHRPPPPDVVKAAPAATSPSASTPAAPAQASTPVAQTGGESAASEAAAPVAKDAPGADASLGNRIIAYVLDVLVVMGIGWGVGLVIGFLPLPSVLGNLGTLLGIAYILTRDALPFLEGQSIGKKAMKIRAVNLEGKPLTNDWQSSVVRNVAFIIPIFALVELIILITRQDKPGPLQRLGDEWAKTKVVNEGPPAAAAETSAEETSKEA